jgi:hypothetical protein
MVTNFEVGFDMLALYVPFSCRGKYSTEHSYPPNPTTRNADFPRSKVSLGQVRNLHPLLKI